MARYREYDYSEGEFISIYISTLATRAFLELLSLTFTTLLATGLGDILPIGSAAQVPVMLEQFAEVVYIAVVVSRLIGMTIVQHRRGIKYSQRPNRNTTIPPLTLIFFP